MMKRFVVVFFNLFGIMSIFTNGNISFDGQQALAQRMYSEPIDGGFIDDVYVDGIWDPSIEHDKLIDEANDLFNEGVNNDSDGCSSNEEENNDCSTGGTGSSNNTRSSFCKGISQTEILQAIWKPSTKIKQTGSTCSAATLQKLLADTNPVLYRKIVMSLYNSGKYEPWGLELSECYQKLKMTDVKHSNNPNEKFDPVDLIMQGAFINRMNAKLHYDPTLDDGNLIGDLVGVQFDWRLEWMIKNVMEYPLVIKDTPSFDDLCKQNYKDNFIIGLVYYNDDNYDFQGDSFHQHYAQIIGTSTSSIQYWSWASNHSANKKSASGVKKIFIISRKKK